MASQRRRRAEKKAVSGTGKRASKTPDGLATVMSCLADLRSSSDLLLSYSLTMEKPGQSATVGYFARQVKTLSTQGLQAAQGLRVTKREKATGES